MINKTKLILGSPSHWPMSSCCPQKIQDLPVAPRVLDLSRTSLDHWNLPVNYLLSSESCCLPTVRCSVLGLSCNHFGLPTLKEMCKQRRGLSAFIHLRLLYTRPLFLLLKICLVRCFAHTLLTKSLPSCFSNWFSQLDDISFSFILLSISFALFYWHVLNYSNFRIHPFR